MVTRSPPPTGARVGYRGDGYGEPGPAGTTLALGHDSGGGATHGSGHGEARAVGNGYGPFAYTAAGLDSWRASGGEGEGRRTYGFHASSTGATSPNECFFRGTCYAQPREAAPVPENLASWTAALPAAPPKHDHITLAE